MLDQLAKRLSMVAILVAICFYSYFSLLEGLRPSHTVHQTLHAPPGEPDAYYMGAGTLKISRSQLHGKIRRRLVERLQTLLPHPEQRGIAVFEGGAPVHIYSSDGEGLFKQDSYMFYLFGVNEESFYGAIDIRSGSATLFMPRLPASYAVWMGPLKSPDDYKAKYAVDHVFYVDEMKGWLESESAPHLHVMLGVNTDSGLEVKPASFDGVDSFVLEKDVLFDAVTECRVIKTPEEIEILRYANKIAAQGHVRMMRECTPGVTMEYQLEASFLHQCYNVGGARTAPFGPIAASGPNNPVLHYGHAGAPNDRQIQDGDLCLMDMGCTYYQYGSDITATWPANGKFTDRQRQVYNAVLRALQTVNARIKPGVPWTELHKLSLQIILEDLLVAGVLQGSVGEMMEAGIGALFMPHGLGHLLGLDVHDVGGYPPGGAARDPRPGFNKLRTARILEVGMVVTVEPGCYFNPALLLPALEDPAQSRFFVKDVVVSVLNLGGVRMEDNLVVTEDGSESLTHVPRSIPDVERVMAGGRWVVP